MSLIESRYETFTVRGGAGHFVSIVFLPFTCILAGGIRASHGTAFMAYSPSRWISFFLFREQEDNNI